MEVKTQILKLIASSLRRVLSYYLRQILNIFWIVFATQDIPPSLMDSRPFKVKYNGTSMEGV